MDPPTKLIFFYCLFMNNSGYIRRSDVKKEIMYKAEKAYRQVKLHQDAFMNRFCCDFNLLERKCDDYIWKKSIIREDIIHYFVTQYI